MKIKYNGGTIMLNTWWFTDTNVCTKACATYGATSFKDGLDVSRRKYLFFKKTDNEYRDEIERETKRLVDEGKEFIDSIARATGMMLGDKK